ncbi:hypothetical protein GGR58DRAFT_526477 [Xylaria digitata]|nr:hypothetical protein GGR58DRAFT_526477 [Xylaria digitata]
MPAARRKGALLPHNENLTPHDGLYSNDSELAVVWHCNCFTKLPSSDLGAKASTDLTDEINPAKIKDQLRSKLGADAGKASRAEVDMQTPSDLRTHDGKVRSRVFFGYDVTPRRSSIVI